MEKTTTRDKNGSDGIEIKIEENCTPEEVGFLHNELLKYEQQFCNHEFLETRNYNFLVKDKNSKIIGGVNFYISFGASYIKDIWVHKDYRRQGIASELMKKVEDFSIANGAIYVVLDTMEFEAPGFYEKIGYEKEHERKEIFGKYSQYSYRKKI